MAIIQAFKYPEYLVYKTSVCSKATFFYVITILLTFIPPLLIAYRSQGFWRKEDYYREQPSVNYKHEFILFIQTRHDFAAWSSFQNFNQILNDRIRVPRIKSREEDSNHDGKLDSLSMSVTFPIKQDEEILGINVLILFDYKLHRFSYFEMEGLIHIQKSSAIPGSVLSIVGDLNMVQRTPLGHKGRDFRYNSSVIKKESLLAEDFDMFKILSKYSRRNVTTKLVNEYSVWSPSYGAAKTFTCNMNIQYPEQMIRYTLGFWQLLKWAWIQYAAILWIFVYLFHRIKAYVFINQIVPSIVTSSISKRR